MGKLTQVCSLACLHFANRGSASQVHLSSHLLPKWFSHHESDTVSNFQHGVLWRGLSSEQWSMYYWTTIYSTMRCHCFLHSLMMPQLCYFPPWPGLAAPFYTLQSKKYWWNRSEKTQWQLRMAAEAPVYSCVNIRISSSQAGGPSLYSTILDCPIFAHSRFNDSHVHNGCSLHLTPSWCTHELAVCKIVLLISSATNVKNIMC